MQTETKRKFKITNGVWCLNEPKPNQNWMINENKRYKMVGKRIESGKKTSRDKMIHKPITVKWHTLWPFTLQMRTASTPKVWKRKEGSEKNIRRY